MNVPPPSSVASRWSLNSFRRITTSGQYMPLIDGFRFVAIFWVMFHHLHGQILKKTATVFSQDPELSLAAFIANLGNYGVELFFIISGFILGLPFAKWHLQGSKRVSLKAYYLRRVTRLEPPYLFALFLFFGALALVKGWAYTQTLIPDLLCGSVYLCSIIREHLNPINCVSWSLEIEVQFYLLAPVLTQVFRLPAVLRRLVLVACIVGFSLIPWSGWTVMALPNFLPYFLMGFVLVDLYLGNPLKGQSLLNDLLACVSLYALCIVINGYGHARLLAPWLMFVFLVSAAHSRILQRILTNLWVISIGGMCYSIYLIHFPLIAFFGRVLIDTVALSNYTTYFFVHGCLLLPCVLIVSAIFYKLVEQPCMDPIWARKLYSAIKRILFSACRKKQI